MLSDDEWDELIDGVNVSITLMDEAHIDSSFVDELAHEAFRLRNLASTAQPTGGRPTAMEFLSDEEW